MADVIERVSNNDSIITLSSFADDDSILVSNTSNEVFETTTSSSGANEIITISDSSIDGSVSNTAAVDSISDLKDATVFKFEKADSKIKRDYNACGKRFERATGFRATRNNPIELKPVRF